MMRAVAVYLSGRTKTGRYLCSNTIVRDDLPKTEDEVKGMLFDRPNRCFTVSCPSVEIKLRPLFFTVIKGRIRSKESNILIVPKVGYDDPERVNELMAGSASMIPF